MPVATRGLSPPTGWQLSITGLYNWGFLEKSFPYLKKSLARRQDGSLEVWLQDFANLCSMFGSEQ